MISDLRLLIAVENLHDHVDNCPACHCEQTALCPVGNVLNEFAAKLRSEIDCQNDRASFQKGYDDFKAGVAMEEKGLTLCQQDTQLQS